MKDPYIEWVEVEEQLPVIPERKYGVEVLVATFDPVYAELHENLFTGYDVQEVIYGFIDEEDRHNFPKDKEYDFQTMYYGDNKFGSGYAPTGDRVTHWRYQPKPPTELPKWYQERKNDILFLTSEINEIESIISGLGKDDIIARIGFEERLKSVKEELAKLSSITSHPPAPDP